MPANYYRQIRQLLFQIRQGFPLGYFNFLFAPVPIVIGPYFYKNHSLTSHIDSICFKRGSFMGGQVDRDKTDEYNPSSSSSKPQCMNLLSVR